MTEREALLRAVCENPDDDTPRLVFADWLEEHGDEARAEFIRLQVLMAQVECRAEEDWPSWQQLCAREQVIRLENDVKWWAELPDGEGYKVGRQFVRGFVESVFVTEWTEFACNANVISSSVPIRVGSFECLIPFTDRDAIHHLERFRTLRLLSQMVLTEDDVRVLTNGSLPLLKGLHLLQRPHPDLHRRLLYRFGDNLDCYVD